MRLLAMDIGGTNSRFADCHYQSKSDFNIESYLTFKTNEIEINGFQDLLNHFNKNKPESFLNFEEYSLISIAIAGPVNGRQSFPPNISWNVDLDDIPTLPNTYLINDFVAQAYAFSIPDEVEKLELISGLGITKSDSIAIVGAGTGLGHSLLLPDNDGYRIISSEAGHTCFTFTKNEKEIELFILNKTKRTYVINDEIISGNGISLIHEFLTGKSLSPKNVFADKENNELTLNYFSRFYGRACRNFCLSVNLPDALIITGGITAKHPEIINNGTFVNEFTSQTDYQEILTKTSILLNNNENIGLTGSIIYALSH
jgi:glucokinase